MALFNKITLEICSVANLMIKKLQKGRNLEVPFIIGIKFIFLQYKLQY